MGYAGWKVEEYLGFPPDLVFQHLVGILPNFGAEIDRGDRVRRAVVATASGSGWIQSSSLGTGPTRIAALVESCGTGARLTLECGPIYGSGSNGESFSKQRVECVIADLWQSLKGA